MSDTLRGAALMVAAMLAFSIEDALIKGTATLIPAGQVMMTLGLFGTIGFALLLRHRGQSLFTRALLTPAVLFRSGCELLGTAGFVAALTLGNLSTATAILQAVPLVVVLGAALFLGEQVGWRRWTAVGLGLVGVMMVIRPGAADFDPNSLFALVAVVCLSARDLATRRIPAGVPSNQLSGAAFATTILSGLLLFFLTGERPVIPSPLALGGLAATLVVGMVAYSTIVAATRIGEMSVIAPFRYTRILFALLVATLIFGERPDAWTYAGAALIVGSGLYAFWREAQANARARAASLPPQPTL